ncbi:response regulator [Luteibaculum oceani]|uniref:Response regulator n=1 Tax=Luteibaculum oceani TaxID=1294296 RepID=A0A5C6VB34_9FLAO|nr:response regulator [Luteibaculum oceani]TXC82140.1 response regulator [Luteibaculum oceani]
MSELGKKIWLVDDDPVYQSLTIHLFEMEGSNSQLEVYSNGLEAIQCLESRLKSGEELPKVILLDLFMPVMDGWGFLEEFDNQITQSLKDQNIIIYVISSTIDPDDISRAKSNKCVRDFFIKPIRREELFKVANCA